MTQTQLEKILGHLWPTDFPPSASHLYAIVDGARDPRIHRLIAGGTCDARCLYAGKLPPVLIEVAPYLVEAPAHAPFTRRLLSDGWGLSWGIWLSSAAPIDELRRHFRRFLRVEDERRQRLLFRYYDPRVLRGYLPSCNAGELGQVFGPVERILVESFDAAAVLEYSHDWSGLRTRALPCVAAQP